MLKSHAVPIIVRISPSRSTNRPPTGAINPKVSDESPDIKPATAQEELILSINKSGRNGMLENMAVRLSVVVINKMAVVMRARDPELAACHRGA